MAQPLDIRPLLDPEISALLAASPVDIGAALGSLTNESVVEIRAMFGATPPPRGHSHDATEIYVILSGEGDVVIEGNPTPVREGSAVWIPEGLEHYAHNTGPVPLRLLYMFARDKFSDVTYSFPGED